MDFEEIYQKYFTDVYRFILSICKNPTVAEDIVHETFLKAIKNAHKLDDVTNLNSWLCRIAKNTFLDYLDKNKKNIPILEMDFKGDVDIEGEFLKKEKIKELHRLVKKLETPYKEVFSLRIYANLSFKEISAIMGETEAWSRQVFHRAKIKIKGRLK